MKMRQSNSLTYKLLQFFTNYYFIVKSNGSNIKITLYILPLLYPYYLWQPDKLTLLLNYETFLNKKIQNII